MRITLTILFTLLKVFSVQTHAEILEHKAPGFDLTDNHQDNLKIVEIIENGQHFERDGLTIYTDLTELQKKDRRKQKTLKSPKVLDAVGKINIIYSNGKKAQCSGTLISTEPGSSSRTIASAAHCFGNTMSKEKYNIKYITWVTTTKSGETITADLTLEELNLTHDNALLSMKYKLPYSKITPVLYENELTLEPTEIIFYNEKSKIIAAGYSADDYRGNKGQVLTYDDEITYNDVSRTRAQEFNHDTSFDLKTVTFSGSSGGAILIDTDLSEEDIENPYHQLYYLGTVIQVNGNGSKLYGYKEKQTTGSEITTSRSYTTINPDKVIELNNR